MEIERRIYNKNDADWFYGVYTLINLNGFVWQYINHSLLWDNNKTDNYLSIYVDEPDAYYVNFKEHHLYEDTAPNL